jgi:hypothetical protein
MADKHTAKVEFVTGLEFRPKHRAVAFLTLNAYTNAAAKFADMRRGSDDSRRDVLSSFDLWMKYGTNDRRFHGWPGNPEYKHCHTFKWKERRRHNRFYGFKCHPNKLEPGFQLCVLAVHATKNSNETDFTLLDRINEWREDETVASLIHVALRDWLAENTLENRIYEQTLDRRKH